MLRTLGSIPAAKVISMVLTAIYMNGIRWMMFSLLYGLYGWYRRKRKHE